MKWWSKLRERVRASVGSNGHEAAVAHAQARADLDAAVAQQSVVRAATDELSRALTALRSPDVLGEAIIRLYAGREGRR